MPLTTHIDEDVLELYSLGRLAETQSSGLEEHLLICRACQERLEQTDDFVRAFRMAVRGKPQPEKPVAHRRRWWNWAGAGWQPIPAGAALALVAIGVIALAPRSVPTEEIEVRLSALRGSGSGALATVPAQRCSGLIWMPRPCLASPIALSRPTPAAGNCGSRFRRYGWSPRACTPPWLVWSRLAFTGCACMIRFRASWLGSTD